MAANGSALAAPRRPLPAAASRLLGSALVALALLLGWQALHWMVGSSALSSPRATAERLAELWTMPDFSANVAETGKALVLALALSGAGGLALGVLLGAHRLSGEVAEPVLVAVYALPKVTLYPLVLLAFGLGLPAKVAFGAMHGIIPVALFAMNGLRNIPGVLLRTARSLRMTPTRTAARVLLPAALPEIVTGLRLGFSLTLLGVLIGEMFASQRGLGFLLTNAIGLNDATTILAVTALIAVFALAINAALLLLEQRLRKRGPP